MIADNLKLLLKLYVRPWSALSAIVDEGSFVFGLLAVLVVSLLSAAPNAVSLAWALRHQASAVHRVVPPHALETDGGEEDVRPTPTTQALMAMASAGSIFTTVLSVAGLVLLYVPAVIFVMTFVDRRAGSFGVALPRDYGQLAPCALLSWTAAHLPFIAISLGFATRVQGVAMLLVPVVHFIGAALYFGVLMAMAVRIVYGVRFFPALIAVSLGAISLPFAAYLTVLASPFFLYFAFIYLRGDISAIQWSLGSRRSFRRHLEAATINPRDAEAHYQLGLIHQHRRQYAEAIERFQRAIEIDPLELDAHYQLGRIAREQGRHADAIRHFEPVVAKDPKHSRHEIWREVGATYMEAGDFANARPMLERYVENRPYDPEGLFWLGLAYKRTGEAEKSQEMRERCVEAAKTAPDYRKSELRLWRNRATQEL